VTEGFCRFRGFDSQLEGHVPVLVSTSFSMTRHSEIVPGSAVVNHVLPLAFQRD
jgi:hypothetical protein